MSELSHNGATIHYEVWGASGSWVTLVNGHTRPLNDFRMMGKHLVTLGYRVVALDNRGAGQTTYSKPFTLDDMVGDVAALWDEVGVECTALLGISMGGFIAQRLVLVHPERVSCLVLVSTGPGQNAISKDDTPWQADLAAVQAKLSTYFTPSFAARNATLVTSMAKQIAKAVEQGAFAAHADAQRRALAGFDNRSRLGSIEAPTLVIHGREDAIIGIEAGEALAAGIPNAKKALLPGAGHLLLAEKPRELYDLVGAFLAQHRA